MALSLYLHIPFCQVRCSYCDFNTYAGLEGLIPAYSAALAREVRGVAKGAGDVLDVHTIYFGGGTPSLLPLEYLAAVLRSVRASFRLESGVEVTLEVNPGTVDLRYFEGLAALGVNRLSLGVQSIHPAELLLLDRLHTYETVVRAVGMARRAGFENLNLDLMYGLPLQSLGSWMDSVEALVGLEPEHLSMYALSLEYGTPMRHAVEGGRLPDPDPDLAADMIEWAAGRLAEAGYHRYEISNWARDPEGQVVRGGVPSRACRHNLQYWRNEAYLGFGAGAHGRAAGWRYSNVRSPGAYIARLRDGHWPGYPFSPAVVEKESISREREMEETMLLGLRLTGEGVDASRFASRYGTTPKAAYPARLGELTLEGLVDLASTRVLLTPRGRMLGNLAFERFVNA